MSIFLKVIMKRIGFLYEKAFSRENLLQAYYDASKGKHNKRACYEFEQRLATNLDDLYNELSTGTYKQQPYYNFIVHDPKERLIYAPAFRDLVVQHAIYRIIYPIFNAGFIDTSFACRVGKGTHKAADYAHKAIQNTGKDSYILKMDIRRFFYRINRSVLESFILRKIKDKRFVNIIISFSVFNTPVGVPIGNLLSQLFALIYLNALDHFIKRVIKAKYYCRYVDDFIIFGKTKIECQLIVLQILTFIQTRLELEFSKYTIAARRRGVNFVGYRTWATKRFIRKHSLFKFKRALKKNKLDSVISILGHAKNTSSYKYMITLIKEQFHGIYCNLPKVYRC